MRVRNTNSQWILFPGSHCCPNQVERIVDLVWMPLYVFHEKAKAAAIKVTSAAVGPANLITSTTTAAAQTAVVS
jgi:hypothetical protein